MEKSTRQAKRAWAAARRKHIKPGKLFHVDFQHDPDCAIYTPFLTCRCNVIRVLRDADGKVLARIEGAGPYHPLELCGVDV